MTITLKLSDEQLASLKRRAAAEGKSAEDCAASLIESALSPSRADAFRRAAEGTFADHAEAYRRLAK